MTFLQRKTHWEHIWKCLGNKLKGGSELGYLLDGMMISLCAHSPNNTYRAPVVWDAFGGKDFCSRSWGLFLTHRGKSVSWLTGQSKMNFPTLFPILVHRIYCICETSLSLWIVNPGALLPFSLICGSVFIFSLLSKAAAGDLWCQSLSGVSWL